MTRIRWIALAVLGLAVAAAASAWVRVPGYMDAEYYTATARQLADGRGFTEPFLWNYLDDPVGLPHPSHRYWMPLPTALAAAGMALFGSGFSAARIGFLVLAGLLPVLTAWIALLLTQDSAKAWQSGWLAAFSGFFLPFLITTDTFSVYAVIGTVALATMALAAQRPRMALWVLAGVWIGLGNLTRVDGLLLWAPGILAIWTAGRSRARAALGMALGFLVVVAPWWWRNAAIGGGLFPPGSGRALWLLDYDELYSYPAEGLTLARWWASGLGAILSARLGALSLNVRTLVGVNGLVYLGPLMLIGAWQLRRHVLVRLAALYGLLLLLTMTLAFPFAGGRGGFLHSSVGLMPVLWALAPVGLERAVAWAAARRGWNAHSALRVFSTAMVVLAAAVTAVLFVRRVSPVDGGPSDWDRSHSVYTAAGAELRRLDPSPGIVAVNNPPGFYLASGLQAIVVPDGDADALRSVVERYGAEWVILDSNRPEGLAGLYADPDSLPYLSVAATLQDVVGQPMYLLRVLAPAGEP